METLIHPIKGELTQSKRYNPLTNKSEVVYFDKTGKKHKLDGSETTQKEVEEDETESIVSETKRKIKEKKKQEEEFNNFESERFKEIEEQDEKQRHKEEKEQRHKELLDEVEDASETIVEAIKAIPQPIDHSEEQKKWKDEILKALEFEFPQFDLSPAIKAIEAIKIPEVNIPEQKDYTDILNAIKDNLPKDTDMTGVVMAIMAIPRPESVPFKFSKEGRLQVEVDRISMGTGGGGSATEKTLQSIAGFNIPDFDEIQASYPDTLTEVYTYKKSTVTVGIITVIYTTADKDVLVSVVKS